MIRQISIILFIIANCTLFGQTGLQWTNQENVNLVGQEVIATGHGFISGASSKNYLLANQSTGWVEFEMTDNPNYQVLGFTTESKPASSYLKDLEYGVYRKSGETEVWRKGRRVATGIAEITNGQKLRIERNAGVVSLKVDGTEIYTDSDVDVNRDWYIELAFYTSSTSSGIITASFDSDLQVNAVIDDGASDGTLDITLDPMNNTNTPTYVWNDDVNITGNALSDVQEGIYKVEVTEGATTHTRYFHLRKASALEWATEEHVTWVNNQLVSSQGGFAAHASSKNYLPAGEEGWLEFEMTDWADYQLLGFTRNDQGASTDKADMEFGIYRKGGATELFRRGARAPNASTSFPEIEYGDILRIERVETVDDVLIHFKVNGTIIHTETGVDDSDDWFVNTTFYAASQSSGNIWCSFDKLPQIHAVLDNGVSDGTMDIDLEVLNATSPGFLWSPGGETTSYLHDIQNGTYTVTVSITGQSDIIKSFEMQRATVLDWAVFENMTWANEELISTAGNNEAFASSKNYLEKDTDGWLEFEMIDAPVYQMLGFTEKDQGAAPDLSDMIVGISRRINGTDIFYKGEKVIENLPILNIGDRVRINRSGTDVDVLVNNVSVHTVNNVNRSRDWYINVTLNRNDQSSGKISTSFDTNLQVYVEETEISTGKRLTASGINLNEAENYTWSTGETGNTIDVTTSGTYSVTMSLVSDPQVTVTKEIDVVIPAKMVWASLVNATWENGEVWVSDSWGSDQGGISYNYLDAEEDGWLSFRKTTPGDYYSLGFTNNINRPLGPTSMSFGFQTNETGIKVRNYDQYLYTTTDHIWEIGDDLKIEKEGDQLKFYINTTLLYTHSVPNPEDWHIFASADNGPSTGIIQSSFDKNFQVYKESTQNDPFTTPGSEGNVSTVVLNGGATPTHLWEKDGVQVGTGSDLNNIESGDYQLTVTGDLPAPLIETITIWDKIQWKRIEGFSENGGQLTKTADTGPNNCIAFTINHLEPGEGGRLEYTINGDEGHIRFGLAESTGGGTDIMNATHVISLNNNYGYLDVFKGSKDVYKKRDEFMYVAGARVELRRNVTSGEMEVRYNGELLTTYPCNVNERLYPVVEIEAKDKMVGRFRSNFDAGVRADVTISEYQSAAQKGSILITPYGGSGSYTTSWNKNGSSFSTDEDITDLTPGTYQLTLTDQQDAQSQLITSYSMYYLPEWQQPLTGLTDNGDGTLTRNDGQDGSVGGYAGSYNSIKPNEEGKIIYRHLNSQSIYIGLGTDPNVQAYAGINYCLSLNMHGYTYFYQSGQSAGSGENHKRNNIYEISREQRQTGEWDIVFRQNGTEIKKIEDVNVGEQLFVVCHSYYSGETTGQIRTDFGNPVTIQTENTVYNDVWEAAKGEIEVSVFGGAGGYTYEWKKGENEIFPTNVLKPTALETGTYTLKVTDASGEFTTKEFEIFNHVKWRKMVGLQEQADKSLMKPTGVSSDWNNSMAISDYYLKPNQDGFVEWYNDQPGAWGGFGLVYEDFGTESGAQTYWVRVPRFSSSPVLFIGNRDVRSLTGIYPKYGDTYRLERKAGEIIWYMNGEEKKRIATDPSRRLYVTAFVQEEGTSTGKIYTDFGNDLMAHVEVAHNSSTQTGSIDLEVVGAGASSYSVDWTYPDQSTSSIEDISGLEAGRYVGVVTDNGSGSTATAEVDIMHAPVWEDLTNMAVAASGKLTKTGGGNGWGNAWAKNKNYLPAGEGGYFEVVFKYHLPKYFIGLTETPGVLFNEIKETHGYYFAANGSAYLIKDGVTSVRNELSVIAPGDRLRITRKEGQIEYSLNGNTPFYTRSVNMDKDLYLVAEAHLENVELDEVYTSFGKIIQFTSVNITHNELWQSANGAIDIEVDDPEVTYLWSNGETTQDLVNVRAGEYTLQLLHLGEVLQSNSFEVFNKVKWETPNGLNVETDGSLLKTSSENTYESGVAWSKLYLDRNEDGRFVWSHGVDQGPFQWGISYADISSDYHTIAYRFQKDESGVLKTFAGYEEIGTGNYGSLQTGDKLVLKREGSEVIFYKNDQELVRTRADHSRRLYTKVYLKDAQSSSGKIVVDFDREMTINAQLVNSASDGSQVGSISLEVDGVINPQFLWNNGFTSQDLLQVIAGNYVVNAATEEVTNEASFEIKKELVWGLLTNTSVLSNQKLQSMVDGWGNSWAAAEEIIPAGEDGYIEYVNTAPNTELTFGLSELNSEVYGENHNSYSLHIGAGNIPVAQLENGNAITSFGLDQIHDVYRVERKGDLILFTRNGTEIARKENVSNTAPLYMICELANLNEVSGTFYTDRGSDYVISYQVTQPSGMEEHGSISLSTLVLKAPVRFQWSSGHTTHSLPSVLPGEYTLNITDGDGNVHKRDFFIQENIQWSLPTSLEISPAGFIGVKSGETPSGVATADMGLQDGDNGLVGFSVKGTALDTEVGMTTENTAGVLDNSIRLKADGTFEINEGGNFAAGGGSYQTGDKFELYKSDDHVLYFHNSKLIHTAIGYTDKVKVGLDFKGGGLTGTGDGIGVDVLDPQLRFSDQNNWQLLSEEENTETYMVTYATVGFEFYERYDTRGHVDYEIRDLQGTKVIGNGDAGAPHFQHRYGVNRMLFKCPQDYLNKEQEYILVVKDSRGRELKRRFLLRNGNMCEFNIGIGE